MAVFRSEHYRQVVTSRLLTQLAEEGLVTGTPTMRYCLVAGHVRGHDHREGIRVLFERSGWIFWDEDEIWRRVTDLETAPYENDVATIVAKLIRPKVGSGAVGDL